MQNNEQLIKLSETWGIGRVHLKDLKTELIIKNQAAVLNKYSEPVVVKFSHLFMCESHLFIVHESLSKLGVLNNNEMTISNLKTGQKLVGFKMSPKMTNKKIEKLAKDTLLQAIATYSRKYVEDRMKVQHINCKINFV